MSEQIKAAYPHLLENRPLGAQLATEVMRSIMCGEATPAQIGAFLLGYQMRQAQPDEVAAFVRVMREAGETVDAPEGAIDLCGTGGDGLSTFNISTTAAFVAAAGGALVAKHGNRAASSRSGSVDLLEALGLPVDQEPSEALRAHTASCPDCDAELVELAGVARLLEVDVQEAAPGDRNRVPHPARGRPQGTAPWTHSLPGDGSRRWLQGAAPWSRPLVPGAAPWSRPLVPGAVPWSRALVPGAAP